MSRRGTGIERNWIPTLSFCTVSRPAWMMASLPSSLATHAMELKSDAGTRKRERTPLTAASRSYQRRTPSGPWSFTSAVMRALKLMAYSTSSGSTW